MFVCSAGWCDFIRYAFEKETFSRMWRWPKAASHVKQSTHAGFAKIKTRSPPFPVWMSLCSPAQTAPGSLVPGERSPSWRSHPGAATRFPLIHPTGELLLNLALWRTNCRKCNFSLHLLISKRVAWIITQIRSGSRIAGTDGAERVYQIS